MKKRICEILLIFLLASPVFATDSLKEEQIKIPEKDREILETFFQILVRNYPFGYTLCGDKPMSIACYGDPAFCVGKELNRSLALEKGWKVWTRYKDLFPSHTFIMKREAGEKEIFKSNTICLVNKPAALKTISDNLDLFRQKIGKALNPEDILKLLCDPNEKIFREEDLLGILLGFGRNNAVTFYQWAKLLDHLESGLTPPFLPQYQELNKVGRENQKFICRLPTNWSLPQTLPAEGCAEEFNQICLKRKFFDLSGSDYLLNFLDPPAFVDHGENPELYENYIKTKVSLRKIFQDRSFLEATLKCWEGDN